MLRIELDDNTDLETDAEICGRSKKLAMVENAIATSDQFFYEPLPRDQLLNSPITDDDATTTDATF